MIVYDLERKKAVPGREPMDPQIDYCNGWKDYAGMGISVLCAYDYQTMQYSVYFDQNKEDFRDLIDGRLLIGYNSINYDNNVLLANWDIEPTESYDLLQEIWKAAGLGPIFNKETHLGFELDTISQYNLDKGNNRKIGIDANAPLLFQSGRIGSLINYCLQDVALLKRLMDKVMFGEGRLWHRGVGDSLQIRRPDWKWTGW